MDDLKKSIGRRIMEARRKKKMTQQDLADQIESSYGYISEIESGKKEPGITKCIRICMALDISLDHLAGAPRLSNGIPSDFNAKIRNLDDDQINILRVIIDELDRQNKERLRNEMK